MSSGMAQVFVRLLTDQLLNDHMLTEILLTY